MAGQAQEGAVDHHRLRLDLLVEQRLEHGRRPALLQGEPQALGLHARASAKLTQVASQFKANVWVSRNGRRVNAKSIMGVMMLAAGQGTSVLLEAEGHDAEQALAALTKLIANRFGEGE